MTDKELIRQEIERIEQILDDFNKTHNNTIDNGIVTAKKNICKHIKSFIDSLPEEPVNEGLEEEIKSWIPAHIEGGGEYMRKVAIEWSEIVARHFAEWGRNHFEDKSEMVSEDLEEADKQHSKQVFHGLLYDQALQDLLEKAEEWLKDNSKKYAVCYEDGYSHYASNSMIDDFKNHMENESEN